MPSPIVTTHSRGLKIRTSQGMVALTAAEAGELQERLGRARAGQPAGQTMAVSANASTSVTFSEIEKAAVLDVLTRWLDEPSADAVLGGPLQLRAGLAHDLGLG
jgi:hypothetical protein